MSDERHGERRRVHVFPSRCVQPERAYHAAEGPRVALWPGEPSPERMLLVGQGAALTVRGTPAEVLRASQRASLRGHDLLTPRFVGGFAFDVASQPQFPWEGFAPGHFVCPRLQWMSDGEQAHIVLVASADEPLEVIEAEVARFEQRAAEARLADAKVELRTAPTQDTAGWLRLVETALASFARGELDKVVGARMIALEASTPFDSAALLHRLGGRSAQRFAIDVGDATFLGATPELLLRKHGRSVATEALAGSQPRHGDDTGEVASLLASDKEQREHRFVVQAIERALQAFAARVDALGAPTVRTLGTVHHLVLPIAAELAEPTHVLDLLASLHPTPAVCGTPKEPAMAWLRHHEQLQRGYYAGPVGWFDAKGDGEFHVALRSGLFRGAHAWLFAGAGLLPGSEPERELDETRAKFGVMLGALGIEPL